MQVAHQMGHSKIETTKNIYGHLFAQDRALILDAMNQGGQPTVRLREPGAGGGRGQRFSGLMIRKLRPLALRTVGPGGWCF